MTGPARFGSIENDGSKNRPLSSAKDLNQALQNNLSTLIFPNTAAESLAINQRGVQIISLSHPPFNHQSRVFQLIQVVNKNLDSLTCSIKKSGHGNNGVVYVENGSVFFVDEETYEDLHTQVRLKKPDDRLGNSKIDKVMGEILQAYLDNHLSAQRY